MMGIAGPNLLEETDVDGSSGTCVELGCARYMRWCDKIGLLGRTKEAHNRR
jgi:hypothetical protein